MTKHLGKWQQYLLLQQHPITAPGIGVFARIENRTIWRRIVKIRKMQSKDEFQQ